MKKIVILVVTIVLLLVVSMVVASSLEGSSNTEKNNITIQYIEIKIQQGDTMWSISERYRNEMPRDTFINIIQQFNNMSHTVVREGSMLKIPVF